ncbi:MAG TPA: SseB family protein, partial [Microbacterium sp.]|nr:SseB family protein [Microbacterium sp.]
IVRLELMAGLDRAALDGVLARLAKRWAADDRIAVLVDSLTVTLVSGDPLSRS